MLNENLLYEVEFHLNCATDLLTVFSLDLFCSVMTALDVSAVLMTQLKVLKRNQATRDNWTLRAKRS
jgi:hypothetical protein